MYDCIRDFFRLQELSNDCYIIVVLMEGQRMALLIAKIAAVLAVLNVLLMAYNRRAHRKELEKMMAPPRTRR